MKRKLKYAALVLLALVVLLLGWGFIVEPRLIDTEEHVAAIPGLPAEWAGRRIAVVADYQVGMWGANTGTMRRITDRLVRARPAAVLLAGDFVYKAGDDPADEIQTVVEIVRPLAAAGIPTFAVLGNHDYSLNKKDDRRDEQQAERVEAALEGAGIRVLHNEAVALQGSGGAGGAAAPFFVVGIGSEWAQMARPEAALQGVPAGAPRMVFMHNPSSFSRIPAGAAPVAVAGHTHGGQVRLPGTPSWSWIDIVASGEPHVDGWIRDADFGQPGNHLYVNRGIGFSTVAIRINCRPEITYFRLASGAAPRR